jgi:hypothetical protein
MGGILETSNALRETSDALLRDLDVLAALEDEKRGIEPGDPRLVELAGRIEEIAKRILTASVREHQLTQVANSQVERHSEDAPTATIEETQRSVSAILAEWRDAERRLVAAEPGSAEAAEATALVEQLRAEYARAYEAARRTR